MATITEDYVSFETAKLLKEKGFNESCYTYYDDTDGSINRFDKGYHFNNKSYPWGVPYDFGKAKKYVVAPTLQRAMKWLRESHNLFIDIYYDCDFGEGYKFSIHKLPKGTTLESHNENYSTYEKACEEAIKYCLKNLI